MYAGRRGRANLDEEGTKHWRGLSRRFNRRIGSGSSKLGLVLEEKILKGLSARSRFDKMKMSGRYKQALCGRGERIRTSDPCVPNAVRYRAALRPDKINRTPKRAGIVLHQRVETQAMGIGHLPTGNLATGQVHPFCQSSVCPQGLLHALRGQSQKIRKRDVRQRGSRRMRNNPRHIGHTIMEHPIHHIDRVRMGGGFRGFEAAALINRNVHHHGSRLHARHQFPRDQLGGSSPGNEDCSDDEICGHHCLVNGSLCGGSRHM